MQNKRWFNLLTLIDRDLESNDESPNSYSRSIIETLKNEIKNFKPEDPYDQIVFDLPNMSQLRLKNLSTAIAAFLKVESKWEIEFSDEHKKIVTSEELLEMKKNAEKFDGFYGWRVVRQVQ